MPAPGAAPPVPPVEPGRPPISFLVDYDGTIALADVTDAVLLEHIPGEWAELDLLYAEGRVGSRWLMARQIDGLRADPGALLATASRQPHDPGFVPFARRARAAGIPIEVVSDGFGFFIEPALDRLGVPWIPVVTARTTLDPAGSRIEFPNGAPDCLVCGTCKRARVRAHQAAGRHVVFVGDGVSDRYAAGYADTVFAKRSLIGICRELGLAHTTFERFAELDAWLAETLDAWAADTAAIGPPRVRDPWCGAEVWGPGRRGEPDDRGGPDGSGVGTVV